MADADERMSTDVPPRRDGRVGRRELLRRGAEAGLGLAGVALTRGAGVPARAAAPGPSGTLLVGVGALPATLDPHLNNSGISFATYFQLFEGLTNITADGTVEPALATSWKYVDETTLEVQVRRGVTFHNGEPFDASVVKWNIERIIDPRTRAIVKGRIPTVDHVDVVDPYRARIVLKAPAALLVKALAVVFMIPPRYFAAQGGTPGFVRHPVGTGPFRYVEGAPGDHIRFAANDRYWRGAPRLATVEYRNIPEDGARVAALQSGQVDMIQNLPVINVEQIRAAGFQIAEAYMSRMHVINFMIPIVPQLKDKRIRQALNYAVDKAALVSRVMRGHAKLSQGQLVGEDGFGYNPRVKAYPYDPAKARQLLAAAGASRLALTCFVTQGAYIQDTTTMEAVAGFFKAVGVHVTLQPIEFSAMSQRFFANTLTGLNLQGMNYFPAEDADFVFANYRSDAVARMYDSQIFDQALNTSEQELDVQRRLALLQNIDVLLYDDPPVVYLFQPPDLFGVSKRVDGFKARHDARIDLLAVTKT
jgi:peptide/nickel transport system substrate-binding protein